MVDYNAEVSNESYFTLYSKSSQKLPYKKAFWYSELNTIVEPGEEAQILLGTSYEDVTLIYQMEQKGEIITLDFLNLSNEQRLMTIPVSEEHRGNFSLTFIFVKDNRVYRGETLIEVPWSNKELKVEFESFRDKLLPGEEEEWRIRISGIDGEAAQAEMLALLYDASLDSFRKHSFNFGIYPEIYRQRWWRSDSFSNRRSSIAVNIRGPYNYISPTREYDDLNYFGLRLLSYDRGIQMFNLGLRSASNIKITESIVLEDGLEAAKGDGLASDDYNYDYNFDYNLLDIDIRRDFNETAFFLSSFKGR